MNIFKKKPRFYKINTDRKCGHAIMNAYMFDISFAKYEADHATVAFASAKLMEEILESLNKVFGDTYYIDNSGTTISMILK